MKIIFILLREKECYLLYDLVFRNLIIALKTLDSENIIVIIIDTIELRTGLTKRLKITFICYLTHISTR